ncbi:MAG TPA: tetratricopeptide repeat protein [Anaerolineales bacterium]|nr:tetratricopeptide repeat protein [Anaerolineales bacterium]
MTKKRKPLRVFRILILVILIAVVVYFNQVVIPTMPTPFVPTPTATRAPESYISEAEGLFNDGKLLQAISVYEEAIRYNPNDANIYLALARVQVFAGQIDEALRNAENSLLLSSNNSTAYAVRGWALTRLGDYATAETAIKKAIEIDPNNGLAHAYYAELLGNMYLDNVGPFEAIDIAIEESRVATSLSPNTIEANYARGFILEITDNREEAVQAYLAAININPNIPEIHIALGRTYRVLGAIGNAIDEYTLANTLNPSDPIPDLYTSRAYAAYGEFAKAVQSAELAVSNDPQDPYLIGNLGLMLYRNFEWPEAIEQLRLAINGGTNADGLVIEPLELTGDDLYITQYYSAFALVLANTNHCNEVINVSKTILEKVPSDEDAVFNANEAMRICADSLLTPTNSPTP